jgi:hypothetical protein
MLSLKVGRYVFFTAGTRRAFDRVSRGIGDFYDRVLIKKIFYL